MNFLWFTIVNNDFFESTKTTFPLTVARKLVAEKRAISDSIPVATSGASDLISGTAWRCMFEPISARLASLFSKRESLMLKLKSFALKKRRYNRLVPSQEQGKFDFFELLIYQQQFYFFCQFRLKIGQNLVRILPRL